VHHHLPISRARDSRPDIIGALHLDFSAQRGDASLVGNDCASAPFSADAVRWGRQGHWGRKGPHIIVFANEKGGVGKSTLAFHTCVALCNAGESVAAIDLDARQSSLARALENRDGTRRRLKIDFPRPRHAVLGHQTHAGLYQEMNRLGSDASFLIIDVAGHDSPMARHAIAIADTLVTPVNDSFVDVDVLGHIDPVTFRIKALGSFARLVRQIVEARQAPLDWVVVQNRLRRRGSTNEVRIAGALHDLAPEAGYRIAPGVGERVIYRELFPFGLTLLDLKRIPEFARAQPLARAEMSAMLASLRLPIKAGF
jgi:chromosome partitioning protein